MFDFSHSFSETDSLLLLGLLLILVSCLRQLNHSRNAKKQKTKDSH